MRKRFKITVEGTAYDVLVEEIPEAGDITSLTAVAQPAPAVAAAPTPAAATSAPQAAPRAEEADAVSPMAGVVAAISVELGQSVQESEQVAVIEAMKMKTVIAAHRSGKITAIHVQPGDAVQGGQPLLRIE